MREATDVNGGGEIGTGLVVSGLDEDRLTCLRETRHSCIVGIDVTGDISVGCAITVSDVNGQYGAIAVSTAARLSVSLWLFLRTGGVGVGSAGMSVSVCWGSSVTDRPLSEAAD